jgi:ribosomal protein L13E
MINTAEIVARAKARGDAHHAEQLALVERHKARLTKQEPVRTPDDVARRMADHMRDIEAVRGSVDEDDLLGRGYTLEALRKYGTAARDIANAARERQL